MARYTSAYSSLVNRIVEVELLRRFASLKEKEDPIALRHEINAICRSAVVLLCSHLEAYIKELGEVLLDCLYKKNVSRTNISSRIFYHISKDILEELQNTSDHEKIASKVFNFVQSDLHYWSRSGPFPQQIEPERFNRGFSNPAYDKIRKYLSRFGYNDYNKDLAHHLKARYVPIKNMVDHLVDTRNKIAHGNPSATKTPSEVHIMTSMIHEYCQTTDRVFASWCSQALCRIR